MNCNVCGAALPEGAHFCSACGAPVPVLPELTPDPEGPKAAPLSDMPEPTAPLYAPTEPEPVYAQPVYAEPAQAIPQNEVDSIFNWGVAGLVCAFLFTILGIVFSAIAVGKARRMNAAYGFLLAYVTSLVLNGDLRAFSQRNEAMIITEGGVVVRTPVKGISKLGRSTQGVRVMDVNDGDHVSALATGNPDD